MQRAVHCSLTLPDSMVSKSAKFIDDGDISKIETVLLTISLHNESDATTCVVALNRQEILKWVAIEDHREVIEALVNKGLEHMGEEASQIDAVQDSTAEESADEEIFECGDVPPISEVAATVFIMH